MVTFILKTSLIMLLSLSGSKIYAKEWRTCSQRGFKVELLFLLSGAAAAEKISWQFVVVKLFFLSVNFYFDSFWGFFLSLWFLLWAFLRPTVFLLYVQWFFLFLCSLESVPSCVWVTLCVSDAQVVLAWCAHRSALRRRRRRRRHRRHRRQLTLVRKPEIVSEDSEALSSLHLCWNRDRKVVPKNVSSVRELSVVESLLTSVRVQVELPPLHRREFPATLNVKKKNVS